MHTDYESGEGRGRFDGDSEKTVRHLLVRTTLLTQLRIAEPPDIKAETVNQQTGYKTGWMPRCDFLRGIQIEGIKKSVADLLPATGETGTA